MRARVRGVTVFTSRPDDKPKAALAPCRAELVFLTLRLAMQRLPFKDPQSLWSLREERSLDAHPSDSDRLHPTNPVQPVWCDGLGA